MKISMTPNPMIRESVSCSQYDTGRKFEFELYDGDGVIDTSNVADQMAFYSRKDGTEQILPINGSVPVTTPIEADIQYPDMLRSDQEFSTRESPVTKDGSAKITSLQGKTIVWNQLQNGVSATSTSNGVTFTKTDDTKLTLSGTSTQGVSRRFNNNYSMPIVSGHKYLLRSNHADVTGLRMVLYQSDWSSPILAIGLADEIVTATMTSDKARFCVEVKSADIVTDGIVLIPQVFDLTAMFGAGKEPTVEQFKALFPLSYYAYDTGSLLDFTGTKIKTVCKNLNSLKGVDKDNEYGLKMTVNDDGSVHIKGTATHLVDYPLGATNTTYIGLPNGSYKFSGITGGSATTYKLYATIKSNITGAIRYVGIETGDGTFTLDNEVVRLFARIYDTAEVDFMVYPMIRFASAESGFVPYEYNETDLPISTFFPTGMKSAGSVYDELNETDYITRVGSIDLGDLSWTATTNNRYITTGIASLIKAPVNNQTVANIVCGKYAAVTYSDIVDNSALGIAVNANTGNVGNICIRDTGTYADAAAFKTAMSGVRLYYELATPLENYGVVDLGSLTWTYDSQNTVFRGAVSDIKRQLQTDLANLLCPMYRTNTQNQVIGMNADMCISTLNWGDYVVVRNNAYSDATVFKAAMSGVYLLYEKAESHQLESASIVTSDGEKPLSPEDGKLVCTIDENITSNPGIYEAKISYSKDGKKNYSNKFQIYVERSPE